VNAAVKYLRGITAQPVQGTTYSLNGYQIPVSMDPYFSSDSTLTGCCGFHIVSGKIEQKPVLFWQFQVIPRFIALIDDEFLKNKPGYVT
jgi:hypothetical protein